MVLRDKPQIQAQIVESDIVKGYCIIVSYGPEKRWECKRKYQDFERMHHQLNLYHTSEQLPDFPKRVPMTKLVLAQYSAASYESLTKSRMEIFQRYLDSLLNNELTSNSNVLLDFLDVKTRQSVLKLVKRSAMNEMSGYLKDSSLSNRTFFILKDRVLYTYRDQASSQEVEPVSTILLEGKVITSNLFQSEMRSKQDYTFKITSHRSTTYLSPISIEKNPKTSSNKLVNHDVNTKLYRATYTKSGWLTKRGRVHQNWKKRFFFMRDNKLYYYKTSDSQKQLGCVELSNSFVSLMNEEESMEMFQKQNMIIVDSPKRTWYLCVPEERDLALDWEKVMVQASLMSNNPPIQVLTTSELLAALYKAKDGDVIAISSGVYNINDFHIDKSVQLRAKDTRNKPVLVGDLFCKSRTLLLDHIIVKGSCKGINVDRGTVLLYF
ncbi:SNX14 [Acrasis kona]|uniref:SNX14 n=1 Tax=Acrasis kona TaxID=1008807 RepID=A0AAW2ZE50_9EUKA